MFNIFGQGSGEFSNITSTANQAPRNHHFSVDFANLVESTHTMQTEADLYSEMINSSITRMGGYNQDTLGELQKSFSDPEFRDLAETRSQENFAAGEKQLGEVGDILGSLGDQTLIDNSSSLRAKYNKQKSNIRRARNVAERGAAIYGDIGKSKFTFQDTGYEHNPLAAESFYDSFDKQVGDYKDTLMQSAYGQSNEGYNSYEAFQTAMADDESFQSAMDANVLYGMLSTLGEHSDTISVDDLARLNEKTEDRDIVSEQFENFRELFVQNEMNLQDNMQSLNASELEARGLTAEGMSQMAMKSGARKRDAADKSAAMTDKSITETEREIDADFQKSMSALTSGSMSKKKKVRGVDFKQDRAQ